jgi:hypothetical protein
MECRRFVWTILARTVSPGGQKGVIRTHLRAVAVAVGSESVSDCSEEEE